MNFYARHIGDYLKDTAHLSLLHHGIYARLMDVYYTRELGFGDGEAQRLIGARTKEERMATDEVLAEFFTHCEGTWIQTRCDEEIAGYRHKQELAKRSADARWSKSGRNANAFSSGDANDMRTHSDGNAPKPTPIPKNQEETSVAIATAAAAADGQEAIFALGVPLLIAAGVPEKNARSFFGRLRKFNPDTAIVAAIDRCAKAHALQPVEFLQGCLKTSAHFNRQEAMEQDAARVAAEWAAT